MQFINQQFLEQKVNRFGSRYFCVPLLLLATSTYAADITKLVEKSDDFGLYQKVFEQAAQKLLDRRTCTEGDFKEMGGWLKSTTKKNTYFTYCGGFTISNRIYVNAKTGAISR